MEQRKTRKTYEKPAGPANPFNSGILSSSLIGGGHKNMLTGRIEKQAFDAATFNENYRQFQVNGYTLDPTIDPNSGATIAEPRLTNGSKRKFSNIGGNDNDTSIDNYNYNNNTTKNKIMKKEAKQIKKGRAKKGDSSILDGKNAYKGPWASYHESSSESEYSEENKSNSEEEEDEEEEQQEHVRPAITLESNKPSTIEKEWTEFVGSQEYDYLGRTYMHVPQDLDINLRKEPGSQETFIPKKKIHTWAGHSGGVNALRFFPESGHLLLSCGNDRTVKIWDCHRNNREQLRVYHGHGKAVKDVSFNGNGSQFLSASYDRTIKLWDTETGKFISKFLPPRNSTANSVRFNPEEDKQTCFLSAMSDKTILQWDTRQNPSEVVQTYDHHLGAVNSITFVDHNRRFMTTSDDKSIRVWEWQINVPIKFISDPQQHAMPTVALHPRGKYVAAQSMDNRILVFGATDRFRPNRKKEFMGHTSAGYPIQVAFSPDGKYLMSGDANGYAYFWDWKTTSLKSKFKASPSGSVVTCIAAHPQESSKVVTAGKDSSIYYWD